MASGRGKEMTTFVSIAGKIDPTLGKSIASAQRSISGFGDSLKKVGTIGIGATAAAGIAAIGAALLSVEKILSKSIGNAVDFEKQMSNVATLLDGDVNKRVAELGNELIKVSNKTGVATSDLTDGTYQVISAFGDTADTIKQVEVAARLAKAGNASTTDSVNLLSAVTKGYGDTSAKAMAHVADMAFQTAKLGQTTFPELAASMGKVIPLANSMGVKQEELFGAFATLTGVTGGAAEVTTQMRGAIQGFLKPSKEMSEVIKKLGHKSGQAMIQQLGLHQSLIVLRKAVKGDAAAFAGLFGSVEAVNAVLALTGDQSEAMTKKTKAMHQSTGIANQSFLAQINNLGDLWKMIKNIGSNAFTKIGMKITPVLKQMAERALPRINALFGEFEQYLDVASERIGNFLGTIDWTPVIAKLLKAKDAVVGFIQGIDFKKIISDLKSIGSKILEAFGWLWKNKDSILSWAIAIGKAFLIFKVTTGILKGFVGVVSTISKVTKLWTATQTFLNLAMSANPVGLIIIAVGALIAIGWTMYENWDKIVAWFCEAWNWIKEVFDTFCNYLKTEWPEVWEFVQAYINVFKAFWGGVIDVIAAIWNKLCELIPQVLQKCGELAKEIWQGICDFAQNAWDGFVKRFPETVKTFSEVAAKIGEALKKAFRDVKEWAINMMNELAKKITGVFSGIKNFISNLNPFGGKSNGGIPGYAAGGFTRGVSICGEAGTEAVISFDPRYRTENQGYVMQAADMLGMVSPASSSVPGRQSVINLGGVTFAPTINKSGGSGTEKSILAQLEACFPDFMDKIEEALAERERRRYAGS